MRQVALAAALASALLFGARGARADDAAKAGEASPAPAPPRSERWYGYQTLLLDVVPLVAMPVGIVSTVHEAKGDNNPIVGVTVVGLGATSYLFGAPIVHWAHGRVAIGFLSLGIRILAPIAGLGLGAVGSEIATNSKNQDGIPVGAAVGALAAMIFDGAVLGWEKVPDQAGAKAPAVGFVPAVVVTKQAFSLGVTSRF
jgi:hypothetical protein